MLAGMVKAPSRLAPTRNLALAQKRSRLVLQAMADTGVISQSRAEATRSARPVGNNSSVPTGTYFADWVAPQAAQAFDADYGEVRVPTTLDADLQRIAVRRNRQRPDRRCAGGAGGDAARWPGRGDGRRAQLRQKPVQSRDPGAAPAGQRVQAVRLSRGPSGRLHARQHHRGPADHRRWLVAGQ